MPFYETIFETGDHSIAFYEDDEEASRAMGAHHDRAINGESGKAHSTPRNDLPSTVPDPDFPATRVTRALVYENHPADYGVGNEVEAKEAGAKLQAAVKELTNDSTINVHELANAVRELSSPLVVQRGNRHDSSYKMAEGRELELNFKAGA